MKYQKQAGIVQRIAGLCLTGGLLLLGACQLTILAQVERGTIAGTVRDPSGAATPNVAIVVTNVATGVEYKTQTNDSGEFVAPNLIPGDYSITATLTGFKTLQRKGIVLQVNGRSAVDLTLEVGEVTQEVEVTAAAPLLQSESSAVGNVISRREVSDLPLNGRSVFQLAPLTAGVNNAKPTTNANNVNIPDNARAQQGLSVNGQRESSNTYILDGVYNNQINQGLIAILPPLEAIQEFTVETSNFMPEIGRGGGVVNVTLKSGTNEIHGQAFEFHRNAALDARNFFDRTSPRRLPNFVQNQFGGAIGGPIVKNKTFFFGDYQGLRQRQGQTFVTTIPGPNIRRGDFRGTARAIFDPASYNAASNTRSRFPTDMVIDSSRFNPAAVNVLKFIPESNDPNRTILANGEAFFYGGASRSNDQDSFDIKIDHRIGEKDQFSGRYSFGNSHTILPGTFSDLPQFAPAIGGALSTGGAGFLTGIVDNPARSLGLQEIHNFSPTTLNEFRAAYIRAGSDAVQLGKGNKYADQLGIPNVNVTENNDGFPQMAISGFGGIGDAAFFPLIELENIYQVLDNVTFIRGSHTFKAGVDFRKVQRNFTQILGAPAGSFSFGGGFTSDPALPGSTGNPFADFLLGIPSAGSVIRNSGLAGIRATEFATYWQDTWKVNQDLTLNYGIRYDLIKPQTEQYDRMSNFDRVTGKLVLPGQGGSFPGLSSRALAKTDKNNFAPRFGFAYKFGDKNVLRASYGIFYVAEEQEGQQLTLNPPFVGGTNYVNTAVPQQINRLLNQGLPVTDPFIPINNPSGGVNALHPDNSVGYVQQRSISIQRQITESILFDVTYVGNNGIHLYDAYDPNQPFLGTGSAQERRPYFAIAPGLTGITYKEQRARSYYDALQVSLTKRFSRGLSFLTNYTWSHAIEIPGFQGGGHQNARNLDADRSNSGNDLRHRFVLNWLYELPFGPGKPYLGNASAVVKGLVAGWQVGTVTIIQSGSPYNITGGAGRPNRTCDGRLTSGRTVEKWFDTSCFTLPAAVPDPVRGGVYIPFGNSGTYLLPGPALINFDISLFKSFNISEAKRFEFRSEFFNAFNHPQFLNPAATVNTGTFGRIVNARPSRQIQMVLKFVF
jgi:Carboxypeptidase regulatory-like domain/TonB dependent receptor